MKNIVCEVCKIEKSFSEAIHCKECYEPNLFKKDLNFSVCPICGCKDLYRKKDFNQALGCIIILIGAIFVPFTYGISLLTLSLLDFLLYKRVKDAIECYGCKSEYKNINVPTNIKSFDHHKAELYEPE
ncbi:MAG: hypothetical protein VX896_06010 [Candidatus Neomarinimicrobiota bacterium]|nr:hypothetical protein [Candidatus Neomarinimicrobiota bacterium]